MVTPLDEFDSAPGFLRDGYLFGSRRFARCADSAFTTRIAGTPVVVMRGVDAARFFYEGGRFNRSAAIPPSVTRLLQDKKSVQTLEGPAHRARKELFVDTLMGQDALQGLAKAVEKEWMAAARGWSGMQTVSLADEVPLVLGQAILAWAGIPEKPNIAVNRIREFQAMVDNAGRFGPANWAARARRLATEA